MPIPVLCPKTCVCKKITYNFKKTIVYGLQLPLHYFYSFLFNVELFFKVYFIDYTITLSHFSPLYPPAPCTPPPSSIPPLSSCPWVIHLSSLASPFPTAYGCCSLFLTSKFPLSMTHPRLAFSHVTSNFHVTKFIAQFYDFILFLNSIQQFLLHLILVSTTLS